MTNETDKSYPANVIPFRLKAGQTAAIQWEYPGGEIHEQWKTEEIISEEKKTSTLSLYILLIGLGIIISLFTCEILHDAWQKRKDAKRMEMFDLNEDRIVTYDELNKANIYQLEIEKDYLISKIREEAQSHDTR